MAIVTGTVRVWKAISDKQIEEHQPSTSRVGRRFRDQSDSARGRRVELPSIYALEIGGPLSPITWTLKYDWKIWVPRYAEFGLLQSSTRWEPIGVTSPEVSHVKFTLGSTDSDIILPVQSANPADENAEQVAGIVVEPGLRATFATMSMSMRASGDDEDDPGTRIEVWGRGIAIHWGAP